MSPEAPPRRFAPVPVETSTKSSRPSNKQDTETPKQTPRKFAVEPAETMSRSSKNDGQSSSQPQARKFAPEPVETTSKSNRKPEEAAAKPKSRFLPQPVETSSKSNRKSEASSTRPKSRFSPQPIETSSKTNRRSPPANDGPPSPKSTEDSATEKPARRKFAPVLIDTSKRSRKSVDGPSTYSSDDKTDVLPGVRKPSYHNSGQQISGFDDTNTNSRSPLPERPRFLLPFERRRDRSTDSNNTNRTHSFRLPDLETIESSESEPSNPPSLSSSPSENGSPITTSDSAISQLYKHATRIRESVDEGVANYLLEIEARRAEMKLREQALAAFPNSDFHEPVEHYVDDEEDSDDMEIDDRPATWEGHDDDDEGPLVKRVETTNWELREMQDHHEQLEQERNAARTTQRKKSTSASPWWAAPAAQDFTSSHENGDRDPELRVIRDRARPPMLGNDLYFPRSASPEPARFDVTQGSHKLRQQMCYLSEQSEVPEDQDGLWGQSNKASTMKKSVMSTDPQQGLWGGFCIETGEDNGLKPPSGPTGLMTPRVELGNPFDRMQSVHHPDDVNHPVPMSPNIILPLTPPENESLNIDGIIRSDHDLDELMERDYPDTFITQVYNYLSLGYPTLARPFDEELSKISGVPIKELRHDDDIAKTLPKGYIRLGQDFEGRGDGVDQELQEGGCARWRAMKLYIREWARQEKNMVKKKSIGGNWGTGARRGSWAW